MWADRDGRAPKNNMQSQPIQTLALAAVCGAGLLLAPRLSAGDALVFSGTLSRPDPGVTARKLKEGKTDDQKLAPVSPVMVVPTLPANPARDPRVDRRSRNAQLEQRNWIDYDQGELDARDEELGSLGILEAGAARLEGNPDQAPAPAGLPGRPNQPRLSSKLSTLSSSRLSPNNPANSANPANRRTAGNRPEREPGNDASSQAEAKATTAGGTLPANMDLRSLLAPGKANSLAPADRANVTTWKDLFGPQGGSAPRNSGDEAAPPRDFAAGTGVSGGTPPGTLAPSATSLGAFAPRSDFTTRPGLASPAGVPPRTDNAFQPWSPGRDGLSSLTPPSAPKAPVVDFTRPPGTAPGALARDPFARPDPFGSPASANPAAPNYNQPPSAPPRSGSGFNSLPTRPGFGR
ncbi:MAG: hypothetical protein RJA22_433 [Verrucomicrobiota bacterium]|jgi:hypothetical protein